MAKNSEEKKREIIKTAFEIWGKTGFFNTSLKDVAVKFNMTKQGLLRHFGTKDNMLKEIANYFFENYNSMLQEAISIKVENFTLKDFIKFYIQKHFNFFLDYIPFFFYFVSPISKKYFIQNIFLSEYRKKEEKEILQKLFLKENCWLKSYDSFFLLRYIYIVMFFLIIKEIKSLFYSKKDFIISITSIEEKQKGLLIENLSNIIINGFSSKKYIPIDFSKIEKEYEVKKEEIPQRDRIFDAIVKVISETSIWEASIEKIAKELGMNKSTLFYYFRNKKEMFDGLLFEEISRNNNLFLSKIDKNMNFYELLYANMVFDRSYFLKDIKSLYYFDWLHFQKIKGFNFSSIKEISKSKLATKEFISKRYFFLIEAFNNNLLNTYNFNIEDFIGLMNMLIVKDLAIDIEMRKEVVLSDVRAIYLIFLYGISNTI